MTLYRVGTSVKGYAMSKHVTKLLRTRPTKGSYLRAYGAAGRIYKATYVGEDGVKIKRIGTLHVGDGRWEPIESGVEMVMTEVRGNAEIGYYVQSVRYDARYDFISVNLLNLGN